MSPGYRFNWFILLFPLTRDLKIINMVDENSSSKKVKRKQTSGSNFSIDFCFTGAVQCSLLHRPLPFPGKEKAAIYDKRKNNLSFPIIL